MTAPRILLIDDDRFVAKLIAAMLAPVEVSVAMNGADGLELLNREAFDLLITDLLMPEKDGIETILELRQVNAALPILAISGGGKLGARDDLLRMAQQLGATATLQKPFSREQLLAAVDRCLSARPDGRQMDHERGVFGGINAEIASPLPGATFGGLVRAAVDGARAFAEAAEAKPKALPQALAAAGGLLLVKGMQAIADEPSLLVRLSRAFGSEVEDYRQTLTPLNQIHETVPEILIVSNMPPVGRQPPKLPDPPLTADGRLPTQFPHRRGWHTDQSYRRPPPDISLFFAVTPVPKGQGQTLFANGTMAYEALSPALKARIEGLEGLHTKGRTGRSREQVLAGDPVQPLAPHERSQRQPVVRVHPVTGRRSLYLCESGQMDWLDGPFIGMQPGPHGDGAALLFELMEHMTRPEFVYVHEWERGDLLIWDNRCLVHAATWFDAATYNRLMWRTTVSGNPGAVYAGERKSWIPADGQLAAAEEGD